MSAESMPLPPLDRAAHLRRDLDFLERELAARESVFLPVWRDLNLVRGAALTLLAESDARALVESAREIVWLGKLGEPSCFALELPPHIEPPRGLVDHGEFQDLRAIGALLPSDHAALAAYARAILKWHARHPHCAVCGERSAAREGGHLRVCRAESCKAQHFPRTDPAVIVLVHDGDRCLLGRQRAWPAGLYSTIAGFVEPGETLEDAVIREVAEEAGVAVAAPRYFRSQPWPFPSSLMLGFSARATSQAIELRDRELEDARWVSRDHLRAPAEHGFSVPGRFSLAGQLIAAYLAGEFS